MALRGGVKTIEHGSLLNETVIEVNMITATFKYKFSVVGSTHIVKNAPRIFPCLNS